MRGTSLAAPSLAAPQLAANDSLDSAALSFLLNRALEEKEKEEEERTKREEEQVKRQEEAEESEFLDQLRATARQWVAMVDERTGKAFYWNDRLSATSWTRPDSSSSSLPGRKRKKKKKKRRKGGRAPVLWQLLVRCPGVA